MPQTVDPKQVSKAETPGASEKDLQQNNATSEHQQTTAQSPVKELNTSTAQGPLLANAISDAMERNLDQRQEQQLYASVWGNCGAVLLKVIPSAAIDYRRQAEQLQNQIDLLITEKKRRGKRFDARDPRIFSQLVTVLGEQGANSLIEAIDGAVAKHGAALQNNPKAVAELLTEISQALSSGGMLAKLGISPQAVEESLAAPFKQPDDKLKISVIGSQKDIAPIATSVSSDQVFNTDTLLTKFDLVYQRLGSAQILLNFAETQIQSSEDSLQIMTGLEDLKHFAQGKVQEAEAELLALGANPEVQALLKESAELKSIFLTSARCDSEVERLQAEISSQNSEDTVRILEERIEEIERIRSQLEGERLALLRTDWVIDLLKDPVAAMLINEQGMHPRFAQQLLLGQQRFERVCSLMDSLASEDMTAEGIVVAVAKSNFSSYDLSLVNRLIQAVSDVESLEEYALAMVAGEYQMESVRAHFDRLEKQEGVQLLAESLTQIMNNTSQDLAERALQVAKVIDGLDRRMRQRVLNHLGELLGNESASGTFTELFRRACGQDDPKYLEIVNTLQLIEQHTKQQDTSVGSTPDGEAYQGALRLRLELAKKNPDIAVIEEILFKESQDPSDELGVSREWLRQIHQYFGSQSNAVGSSGIGLGQALSGLDSQMIRGALLMAQGRDVEGEEVLLSAMSQQAYRQGEVVQDLGIRYARTMGELEGLLESAQSDEERVAIERRKANEESKFQVYVQDSELAVYFEISGENYPFKNDFILAKELAKSIETDVAKYNEMIKEAGLSVETILEDLSRRFQTPESAERFQQVFKEEYGIDIRTYLVRLEDPRGEWHAKIASNPVWEARKELLEGSFSGDRARVLAGATRLYILQGDTVAFHRLKTLCSTMPQSTVEAILKGVEGEAFSLEGMLSKLSVEIPEESDAKINRRDIVEWARAKVTNNESVAQAIELRALLGEGVEVNGERVLDGPQIIISLTSNGTGTVGERKIKELREAYKTLYGEDIQKSEFLETTLRRGGITVLPDDADVLRAIFSGDMRATENALFRRTFHRSTAIDLLAEGSVGVVDFHELNRLVQFIEPERIAELRREIEGDIASDPKWRELGVTSLEGYIVRCSGPVFGQECYTRVMRILESSSEGIPPGDLDYFLWQLNSSQSVLRQMDASALDLRDENSSLMAMVDGTRKNLEESKESYSAHYYNPLARVSGHAGALREQVEREGRTLRQGERAIRTLQHAVSDYGRADGFIFEDNKWIQAPSTRSGGDRGRYLALIRQSFDAMNRGDYEHSQELFKNSIDIAKEHLTIEGGGLANAQSAVRIHYKDAMFRNSRNIRAFQQVEGNYNRTIKGLQYTRTAVFVGGAIIATGGLGAGVLLTTASIGGIAVGSHALEGSLHYGLGNKDAGTAFADAGWGALSDVNAVWTAASLAGLVKALPALARNVPNVGRQAVQLVSTAPRNIGQTIKMHRAAIKQFGFFKSVFKGQTLKLVGPKGELIAKGRVVGGAIRTNLRGDILWKSYTGGARTFGTVKASMSPSQIGNAYKWVKPVSGDFWWSAGAVTSNALLPSASPTSLSIPLSELKESGGTPPPTQSFYKWPPVIPTIPPVPPQSTSTSVPQSFALTPEQVARIAELKDEGLNLLNNFDGLLSGAWERLFGSTGDPAFIPPPPPTPPAGGAPGNGTPPSTGTGGNSGTGAGTPPPTGPALDVQGAAAVGNSYTNASGQQTAASSVGDSGGATSGSSDPTSPQNNVPAEALQAFDELQQIFNSVSDTVQNFPENFSPVYDEIQTTLSEGVAALQDFYNGALALQEQGKQSDPLAQTAAERAATQIANANTQPNSNADSNASADSTANADTNQVPKANEQADADAQVFVLVQRTAEKLSIVNASANELLNKVSQKENHQVAQDQANTQVEQVAQQDGTFMHVRRAEAAAAQMRARQAKSVASTQEEMIERDIALRNKNAVKARGEADKEMQADANVSSEKTATADQELVTKDIEGAKETTASSVMQNSAHAEREEFIDSNVAKKAQVHEAGQAAQMKTQSEQLIRARENQDTQVLMQSKEQASRRHAENEEKLLAQVEEARSQQVVQQEKQLAEAAINSIAKRSASRGVLGEEKIPFKAGIGSGEGDGGESIKVNAQNKAQHSVFNKETQHATGDTASEAKQEAISAKMSQAGVERRESAEVQTVEGAVGAPSFTTQQASISKNMEKLIANLSDQVGNDVQEAASFLAGLDEAPKMMTADRSSQTLLDGSTIDVANTISEVGDAMDVPRIKSADAKRRAIKKTKRRREIEVLIQVLLTRQMESSKREKLLRMLLALGISEIEYRALVSKLGELEVAAQAMAAEDRKTVEKDREALLVEPVLREPESPKMKSHENDPSASPTIKSAPSVTRGTMYQRLLKEKEKNSN